MYKIFTLLFLFLISVFITELNAQILEESKPDSTSIIRPDTFNIIVEEKIDSTNLTIEPVQIDPALLLGDSIPDKSSSYNTWTTPVITDEMTVDPANNKRWKEGNAKFSSRPKDMWELGVHMGHFFIDGDVDPTIPGGFGVGLHLRKAIHYVFSLRLDAFFGQAYGLESQPWGDALLPEQSVFAGYGPSNKWFPSYRTRYYYGAVEGVINIGNLLFHKERNKWNMNLIIGVGLDHHQTDLNLRNENGSVYTNLVAQTGFSINKFNERQGRQDVEKKLRSIYDNSYETPGFQKDGIFRASDDINLHVLWIGAFSVSRKITKRFNIGFEHQVMSSDNDYLDGIKWRTSLDQTNNVDISHYTTFRFNFNIGSFDKKVEPLYWLNPLDAAFNDIAELKKRPILDLTDEDDDGVLDMFDEELDTPKDAPVDVKGRALDSDNDGVIDSMDDQPYSNPGSEVDDKGVAIVAPGDRKITEGEVNDIVNNLFNSKAAELSKCCPTEWFLPMIHFNLDKYCIKPEFRGHMKQLANVMKSNSEVCVTAEGHTDSKSQNDYNQVLSYNRAKAAIDFMSTNYGIDRSRFKLMYNGEELPLLGNQKSKASRYMNRRVEFRICKATDVDMPRPEGAEAGSCHEYIPNESNYSDVRKKAGFFGPKNSGY